MGRPPGRRTRDGPGGSAQKDVTARNTRTHGPVLAHRGDPLRWHVCVRRHGLDPCGPGISIPAWEIETTLRQDPAQPPSAAFLIGDLQTFF
ncbi:Hypothetical protein I596_67 [Dokdonella koreensis DS-123]|uniref:Uncharacterized protein n=1 Tax=Dokdonella koreensis DS-123 TaxID=1300342 RepID=A0A167G383_9GAMM|nr:Hypothetical protein I596_67 [Dokdonella koreensis DS-123]